MAGNSKKAVVAACVANFGIAVAKLVGFLLTGASSMLAEAVHSAADSGNQALLLYGGSKAGKTESQLHPFGYARERYFWAFIVAVVIFVLGSVFALYEGIQKLGHPHPMKSPLIAIGILVAGLALEGWSFHTALKEANQVRGSQSWKEFLKDSKSAELPVVLLEDLGALIGLLLALLGIGLSLALSNPVFDAYATICIGLLLGVIAVFLAIEMHSLLIGEAATLQDQRALNAVITSYPGVTCLIHMRTMHLGPDELLVGAKVEFRNEVMTEGVSSHIDIIEEKMRTAVPTARVIYLEPAVHDPGRGASHSMPAQ